MKHYIGEGGSAISEEPGEGLTVRDYFAAKAMAALCKEWGAWQAARMAYEVADAMMNIRAEQPDVDE